ncbi:hypothetical protein BJX68DRAFT_262491 [Aspergillus pseudodeflectus]|uniref:Uncharacterized protein n=1 Tax=Aspergillus pseudodeflectus TaxID=176178 RepID=A0ABR4L662_9EURO
MPTFPKIQNLSSTLLTQGAKTAQTALNEGAKMAATYGPAAMNKTAEFVGHAANWTSQNPALATSILIGGAIIAAPAVVAAPALSIAGFGPAGVQAGSIAAAVQGTIGNVAAGSTFATLQSAGAAGAGAAVVNGAVQGAAVVGTIGNVAVGWVRARL